MQHRLGRKTISMIFIGPIFQVLIASARTVWYHTVGLTTTDRVSFHKCDRWKTPCVQWLYYSLHGSWFWIIGAERVQYKVKRSCLLWFYWISEFSHPVIRATLEPPSSISVILGMPDATSSSQCAFRSALVSQSSRSQNVVGDLWSATVSY